MAASGRGPGDYVQTLVHVVTQVSQPPALKAAAISAGLEGNELERLMVLDADIQRSTRYQSVQTMANVADSLPGLGIVAAVLGVVVTMQALNGPALGIGQKVAAALVGTFLGILLCYGVIGPLSSHLECLNKAHVEYLQVLRVAIASFFRGSPPLAAIEAALDSHRSASLAGRNGKAGSARKYSA